MVRRYWLGLVYGGIYGFVLVLTGCSPEKARALQTAATQFQSESLAAIEAIAKMHERELEPAGRFDGEVRQEFIANILGYDGNIDTEIVELAIAPYDVDVSSQVQAEWDRFLGELRDQYNSFGAIYDDVQTGAVPPSSAVEESTVLAQKLTSQLTAFAAALDENPPLLLQHRSAILAELETARQQYQTFSNQQVSLRSEVTQIEASLQAAQQQLSQLQQAGTLAQNNSSSQNTQAIADNQRQQQTLINQQQTEQQKRQNILTQIAELDQQKLTLEDKTGTFMEQWQALRTEEQQLLEDTVRQCLKAASIGQDLVELSQTYDQLSFTSLNGAIGNILQKSSILNTFGLSALETKADSLLATLKAKGNWQQITDQSINRINNLLLDKTLPNNLEINTENNSSSSSDSNLNTNTNDPTNSSMELFQLPQ